MLQKVKNDCEAFEKLMVESYKVIKQDNSDQKLPENISSTITEYIFIDFNKGCYNELPP